MEVRGDSPSEVNKRASSTADSSEESNLSKSNVLSNSLVISEQAAPLTPPWPVSSLEAYTQSGVDGSMQNGSTTQSPPIQTMGRSGGYDPNRIPSFSTEFAQLGKSGELTKSQELIFPSGLPPVTEAADMDRSSQDMEKGSGVRETSSQTTKEVFRENAEDHGKEKMPPAEGFRNSASSHHSDGSINSTLSFAFPVLDGNGGRSISVKVDTEKHQQQEQPQPQPQPQPQSLPHAPEATQNAAATKWFSCFSCCSFCC
ncbi:hypothetical protein CK203_086786 [Vitis vinifera]|uniref:Uncharacterized protein n=1 Tax=Vitis vinifera TaxID=29760 RepID=A0A438D7K2_VITVI|nr:hypothetical protein CK203_086786 [Vitis vinifera]